MRLIALALALVLGILVPQGYVFTFLVRYSVMVMLLFAFVDMKVHWRIIRPSHLGILCVNGLLPWLVFYLLESFSPLLAITGFIVALMSTAAAAPVLTGFLHGNVAYVTVSVLLSTCLVGIEIPLSLPYLLQQETAISIPEVLIPVMITLSIPLLAAQAIQHWLPKVQTFMIQWREVSFYLFIANVYIATAKATWFLTREMPEAQGDLLGIGLVVIGVGLANFTIGALIGGKANRIGGSMALGRKNTMFAVWVCLTFLSPITAMGPMCYILFQNLLNSVQLMAQKK